MNTLNVNSLQISNKEKAILAFNELSKYFDVEVSNSTLERTKYSLSVFLKVQKKTEEERIRLINEIKNIREFCEKLDFKPYEGFLFNEKWDKTDEYGLWCECFETN